MRFDKLISKYLDGELSYNEDRILREEISYDSDLKNKFDISIDINHIIKEDRDSIKLPEGLFEDTEKYVFANSSVNNSSQTIPKVVKFSKAEIIYSNITRYSAVAVILLMLGINTLNDIPNNFNLSQFSNIDNTSKEVKTTSALSNSNKRSKFNKAKISNIAGASNNSIEEVGGGNANTGFNTQSINESNSKSVELSNSISTIQNTEEVKESIPTEVLSTDGIDTKDISNRTVSQFMNSNISTLNQFDNSFNGKVLKLDNVNFGVNLSNSLVNNYQHGDVSGLRMSSFSQYLNYSFGESFSGGFEIGYNEIQYDTKASVFVPLETPVGNKKSGDLQKLDLPQNGRSNGVFSKVDITRSSQQFWASIFVEKELFKIDNFKAKARLAVGSSTDGLNGLARLNASYTIFNNLQLHVGSEIRYTTIQLSEANIIQKHWITTPMVTYGISYNF